MYSLLQIKKQENMNKIKNLFRFLFLLAFLVILILRLEDAQPWGFEGHKKITEVAIDLILNLDKFNKIEQSKLDFF